MQTAMSNAVGGSAGGTGSARRGHSVGAMELALIAWAEWYCWCLPFLGYGSGVDKGDVAQLGVRVQGGGGYSNPVLTEVMAQARAHQGDQIRLHSHICELPVALRLVVVLRFCGKKETVQQVAQGLRAADGGSVARFVPWTGPMAWQDVASACKVQKITALRRMDTATKLLETAMAGSRGVRAGVVGEVRR